MDMPSAIRVPGLKIPKYSAQNKKMRLAIPIIHEYESP